MFKTKKFQLVELIVPAGVTGANSQIYFQNQPQLQSISGDRRVYIKEIEAYTADTLVGSPLSNGNTMVTAADIFNAVLICSIDAENAVNQIPLSKLCNVVAPGSFTPNNYDPFILKNTWRMDWTKSYLQVITAPINLPKSYVFGVHYDYEPDYEDMMPQEIEEFLQYAQSIPNYPLSYKH